MPKTRVPHTVPPTFEAFAEALRQDGAWKNVMLGTAYGMNDNDEAPTRFVTVLRRDGSLWRWDRNSGFSEVKA